MADSHQNVMTLCYKETKIGKFALRPIPVLLLEKKGFSKSLIRLYNSLTSLNFDWQVTKQNTNLHQQELTDFHLSVLEIHIPVEYEPQRSRYRAGAFTAIVLETR